ncbi:SPOR domain-containing protein [Rahnella woolbedingensis]|uniref:Cell division protein DamX n=1 Tax=Rahnella woolbedingensis TaxID=1510574 RepID=A0A419N5Z6_9GAMM|nr:SPOR domain-containing protein [Rahnella woolbedingensis]RJT42154.1 SPOR domain-containing protein [Rahnella woolbedingensis]
MDDLTPEDDLKPDTSDRRPPRARKPSPSIPKVAVSRQYVMIGIGIVVLVLLIVGIGSAMKSPTSNQPTQQNNGPKDINLAGNDAAAPAQPSAQAQANTAQAVNGQQPADGQQPKSIGLPPVSSTPTEAQPVVDNGQAKERVDLPGDMSDALSSQQNQVDNAAQGGMNPAAQSLTSLPTAPATVNGSARTQAPAGSQPSASHIRPAPVVRNPHTAKPAEHKPAATNSTAHAAKPQASKSSAAQAPAASASVASSGSASAIKTAPGAHFTLQLSGASQSNSLNAFAKQQGLKNYLVYQTARDGKPWFVLVSGNYASSAEAKRAISSLPAEVQAKKPWVKPVHQVQQDLKK